MNAGSAIKYVVVAAIVGTAAIVVYKLAAKRA